MQVRWNISRVAVAAMVAAVAAVPTASAMPADDGLRDAPAYPSRTAEQDMHASTVQKAETVPGDRHSDATIADAGVAPATVPGDRHSDATIAGAGDAPAAADVAKRPAVLPPRGMPMGPIDPKPIVPASSGPVTATDDGGDGFDWPLALLIAAGAVAIAGAMVVTVRQRGTQARPAR